MSPAKARDSVNSAMSVAMMAMPDPESLNSWSTAARERVGVDQRVADELLGLGLDLGRQRRSRQGFE